MAKVYLLTEDDFKELLLRIDRDPRRGQNGGSSVMLNETEREAYGEAVRFYNYQVRMWLDKVKS